MKTWMIGVVVLGFAASIRGGTIKAQAQEQTAEEWLQPSLPETFSAFAIVMGSVATGRTDSLQIQISRWSTPEERQQLLDTIIERGDERDALREALQKQEETGFIRSLSPSRTRFPSERLRYAWQLRDGKQRRLVLALDRPIGFLELRGGGRTLDYGVTIIVLDVDAEGQGTGLLSTGTKVTYDRESERLIMEYYATEPVRLTNVRKTS